MTTDSSTTRWSAMTAPLRARAVAAVRTLSHEIGVRYAEVVLTLPASDGARLDPADIDVIRGELRGDLRDAGAAAAQVILLVSPAEVTRTAGVSALLPVAVRESDACRWLGLHPDEVVTAAVEPTEVAVLAPDETAAGRIDIRFTDRERGTT